MGMFDFLDKAADNCIRASTEIGGVVRGASDLAGKISSIEGAISSMPANITVDIQNALPFDCNLTKLTSENTGGIFNQARNILNSLPVNIAQSMPPGFTNARDLVEQMSSSISSGTSISVVASELNIELSPESMNTIDTYQNFMNNPGSLVSDMSDAFVTGIESVTDTSMKKVLSFMGDSAINSMSEKASPKALGQLNSALSAANTVSVQKDLLQEIYDNAQLPFGDPEKWGTGEIVAKSNEAGGKSVEVSVGQFSAVFG